MKPLVTSRERLLEPHRPPHAPEGRGWRTEIVYAITDLAPHEARPEELGRLDPGTGRSSGLH
jgi:hypothetical protein